MLKAAPAVPEPRDLALLMECSIYPDDNAKGKELQRAYGHGVIPPVAECESGAGAWWRITGGTADFSTERKRMSVSEVINREW
jgi:hypothetical protein